MFFTSVREALLELKIIPSLTRCRAAASFFPFKTNCHSLLPPSLRLEGFRFILLIEKYVVLVSTSKSPRGS